MGCKITAVEYALPDNVLTNDDLAHVFKDWDSAKIEKKVGVRERRVVSKDQTSLDLAEAACLKLFERVDKSEVDYVLLCTETPDHYLPPNACLLQDRLGLGQNVAALDFNMGCTGYIHGLSLSKGLIAGGVARKVLFVTSETYSKLINPEDRANRTVFGDAAAATIIEPSDIDGVGEFVFGTDGGLGHTLIVPNGGLRNRYDPEATGHDDNGSIRTDNDLYMNGPEIFNFLNNKVPELYESVLKSNGLDQDGLDMVLFHQANKYMLEYLRRKIGISKDKYYNDITLTGNTVSASIPLALKDCLDSGRVQSGDRLLVAGFGVGLSWAGTVITL